MNLIHILPINRRFEHLLYGVVGNVADDTVPESVGGKQGFKAGGSAPLVTKAYKRFVENDGKDAAVE